MSDGRGPIFLDAGHGLVVFADEVEERFVQAGGPGGQHVNKVATAVQLRFAYATARALTDRVRERIPVAASHLVTTSGDLLIEAKRFRSQEKNRADARSRLAEILREAAKPPQPPRKATRPTRASVKRRLDEKSARKSVKAGRGRLRDVPRD